MSSDGEGLPQLDLELVDAYKKRFMPQNGQVPVLKCSPVWKKMRSFKTLCEFKLKFIPIKKLKCEAMAVSAGKETLLSLWKKSWNKKG